MYKFDGFLDGDLDKIKPYIEGHFDTELDVVSLSTKGWNWGEVDFQGLSNVAIFPQIDSHDHLGSALLLNIGAQPAFELPLQDVAQCFVHKKNEVSMEFHHDDKEGGAGDVRISCSLGSDPTIFCNVESCRNSFLHSSRQGGRIRRTKPCPGTL